jgi:hypothetical protein
MFRKKRFVLRKRGSFKRRFGRKKGYTKRIKRYGVSRGGIRL